jgi:hypothetical protein
MKTRRNALSDYDHPIAHEPARWAQFEECVTVLSNYAQEMLLGELIPPWCSGIDPSFWLTKLGKAYGLLFWSFYEQEAVSLRDVIREVSDGHYGNRAALLIRRSITWFPVPNTKRFYARRSELDSFKATFALRRALRVGHKDSAVPPEA